MDSLRFLSPAWIRALADAAAGWRAPEGVEFSMAQIVEREGDEPVSYHLVISGGRLAVGAGPVAEPSVTVRQPHGVAVAIARGELNAQRAMAEGRLKVSGDIGLLALHGKVFAGLEDVFSAVRRRTVY